MLASLLVSVLTCGADPTGHADSAAAFSQCLSAHPTGGLFIPTGRYRIATSFTKNRNQNLIGAGSKASVLVCESPKLPCVVAADSASGPNNYAVSGISNLGLEGPGAATASIGIFLGADPTGVFSSPEAFGDSVLLDSVRVTGFHHAIEWGNNAYNDKIRASLLFANDVALFARADLHNSGEAIGVVDSVVFNNRSAGIEDHAGFEWMILDSSFDYNQIAIAFDGSTIHAVACHFEQEHARVFYQPFGFASLSLRDSQILIQNPTGTDDYILDSWPQSLHLVLENVRLWSNHPVRYFMHAQGSVTGSVANLYGNGNKKIAAFSNVSQTPALAPGEAFAK